MKTSTIFAITFGLMSAAGLSNAAIDPADLSPTLGLEFEATDANQDGWVSRDEADERAPVLEDTFTQADTNDDDNLSEEEFNLAFITATSGVGT